MKRSIVFTLLLSFFWGAMAQHHATITIESQQHEKFFLYLNNQQQNTNSRDFVSVSELSARGEYRVEVVMDNRERSSASVQVQLHPGDNNYVLEYDRRDRRIMLRAIDKHAPAAPGHSQGNHDARPPKPQPDHHGDPHHQEPAQRADHRKPAQPAPQAGTVPPPPHAPAHCSDRDFQEAKRLVAEQDFETSKLKVAKQVVQSEKLTTSQIVEIARLFEFENSKLEFLKFAYEYCFDPNKYYLVNSVFEFESSKNELNKFVEKNRR